jgi:hypothetical protein
MQAMSTVPVGRPDATPRYEIRLRGRLPARWAAWVDGMTLTTTDDGTTVLAGPVIDQAALHGVLQKVRDLGLPLISLTALDPDARPATERTTT